MDIIADSLTKIRNATMRGLSKTTVRKTKLIEELLKIMKREGYIENYKDSAEPFMVDVALQVLRVAAQKGGVLRKKTLGAELFLCEAACCCRRSLLIENN